MQADAADEVDPLESFMAEMSQEAKTVKPAAPQPKPGLELDDDDNVADYLEVLRSFALVCDPNSTMRRCCVHASAPS